MFYTLFYYPECVSWVCVQNAFCLAENEVMRNGKKGISSEQITLFIGSTHIHTHTQTDNDTKKRTTKMASRKWKRYALKKIKFNTFFSPSLHRVFCVRFYTVFNINYMLCVCATLCYLFSFVVCVCLFLCHFSHLVFIFIQRLHHWPVWISVHFRLALTFWKWVKKQQQNLRISLQASVIFIDYCNDGVTKINAHSVSEWRKARCWDAGLWP